jgi:hypothetical protein
MNKELERKLKRQRVEACLNCKKFVECDSIGKFEECVDFEEVNVEKQVVIISLKDYCALKNLEKDVAAK